MQHVRAAGMTRPIVVIAASLGIVGLLGWLLVQKPADRGPAPSTQPLVLYCAAGIMKPVEEICRQYETEYGVPIQLEPGGSGTLLSKIRVTRGRAHLFLAADNSYIEQGRADGLIAEAIPAARMHPVIGVAAGNPKKIHALDDLLRPDVKVALANPELASVGRTVKQTLTPSGFWAKLEAQQTSGGAKVSMAGTVNEVAQSVKIGAVDAGLMWDSTATQFGLDMVEADVLTAVNETVMISVLTGHDRAADALRFARYMTARDKGQLIFAKHNFRPIPDADLWSPRPEVLFMAGAMLKPGIEEMLKQFETREGVTIKPVYNGCGILVAQMKTGNMPEAYFACDVSFMTEVQDKFDPAVNFSRNAMVLVVQKGNPRKIQSLEDLTRPGLKIGFAHPTNSALGALTDRMLIKLNLHDRIYNPGSTVIHTDAGHMLINQLRTGALDACVVYRSNAMSNPENPAEHLEVIDLKMPEAMATQPYAVAKQGEHRYLMQRLLDAIAADQTRRQFLSIGFEWVHEPQGPRP